MSASKLTVANGNIIDTTNSNTFSDLENVFTIPIPTEQSVLDSLLGGAG